MEEFFIKSLQLIVSLSILVVIHELGHFLFARVFKIRVEKFYLFFNPWFSLFKYKPKNSDTEYGIGWLPLGGYVKIAGMMDESMDKEQLALTPKPWEFRSKPAWQRLLVMVGGVLFNFILALIIYSGILFCWGDTYLPLKNVTAGMEFSQEAKDIGFQDHDILLSVDGKEFIQRGGILYINTLMQFLDAKSIVVNRAGKEVEINPTGEFAEKVIAAKSQGPAFEVWAPSVIGLVADTMEAKRVGLQVGDSIGAINGVPVSSFGGIKREVRKHLKSTIPFVYYRDTVAYTVAVSINDKGQIGIGAIDQGYKVQKDEYNFGGSIAKGSELGLETLKAYIAQIRFLFSKDGLGNLGGFGSIGSMFGATWDWEAFWGMTAFLSIVLAFMNILPIPMLDGGHIMFLLYELITRRKPNEKFQEYAQTAGMIFLFALILFANGNDLFRYISAMF